MDRSNRPQYADYIFDVVTLWLLLELTGGIFKVGVQVQPPRHHSRQRHFQGITVSGIAVLYTLGSLSFPVLLALLFWYEAQWKYCLVRVRSRLSQIQR